MVLCFFLNPQSCILNLCFVIVCSMWFNHAHEIFLQKRRADR